MPACAIGLLAFLAAGLAYADAVSFAPGQTKVPSGGDLKQGPGAVCAHAEVAKEVDPAAGGQACSDETKIGIPGGIEEKIISSDWTFNIGNAQTRAYGTPAPMGGGLPVGRSLQYVRTERNDKIGDAKLMNNSLTLDVSATKTKGATTATAKATQTILTPIGKAGKITGLATSSVTGGKPNPGFGVATVNDPFLVEPDSLSEIGEPVEFTIGTDTDVLKLQASNPGDFAEALYELGFDSTTALSMRIGLDSTTTALDGLDVQFFAYDPNTFGFADGQAFFDAAIAPYLNEIDPNLHLLIAKSAIPLYSFDLTDTTSTVVTFNYAAVTGTVVPEPGTMTLMGLGLAACGLLRRRRHQKR